MTIFGTIADVHSLAAASQAVYNSTVNGNFGADDPTAGDTNISFDLYRKPTPSFIKFDLSGNEVFCVFNILSSNISMLGGGYAAQGDFRKLFCIKNSDGKVIAGIGHNKTSGVLTDLNLALFVFDGATTPAVVASRLTTTQLSKTLDMKYKQNIPVAFHLKIDTDVPANSFLRLYYYGSKIAEVTGAIINTASNLSLGRLTIGEFTTVSESNSAHPLWINSLVVASSEDHTLRAFVMKPKSLATPNDFTGSVANINSLTQNKLYLATSLETGATVTILLNKLVAAGVFLTDITSSPTKVAKLETYFMGRYIQAGGVSAVFGITLFVGSTQVTAEQQVTIVANTDDNKYLTAKIAEAVVNLQTSQAFNVTDLQNLKAIVRLVGV